MYLIKYRKEGEKTHHITFKTERGMMNKVKELNDDPLVVSIRIFKEITYGDQQNLFSASNSPF